MIYLKQWWIIMRIKLLNGLKNLLEIPDISHSTFIIKAQITQKMI
jgi:hypothetical protein